MSEQYKVGIGRLSLGSDRLRAIGALALPIVGGMVSQNILNIVDTLMVSRLGADAVAGVGIGSFFNFVSIALITGMSAAVQAISSRRLGEGKTDETAVPLNGGLVIVLLAGVPMSIGIIAATPYVFPFLASDPAVVAVAVPYIQVRLIAMIAVGANFSFRGYWNGVSLSKLYLRTLLVMHVVNVVLNYAFIFGKLGAPEMGATGAAIGTAASTYVGTAYYFYLGSRYARDGGFLKAIPSWTTIRTMIRVAVPNSVQQLFFAAGFTVLFSIVGRVGTDELAAANVLIQIMLVAILPGLGLGLAAASLVGQALGRGDPDDATQWGWDVVKVAIVSMGLLGVPMIVAPEWILGQFFGEEPGALEVATLPLRLVGIFMVGDAVGMVLLNALIGAGATRMAMVSSISTQWGLFLPAAYIVGPVLGHGLLGIWICQICYRTLFGLLMATLWRSRRWANIEV